VLVDTEISWLQIFVDKIHSKVLALSSSNCKEVFITWNGKEMSSGQVTTALQSILKKLVCVMT